MLAHGRVVLDENAALPEAPDLGVPPSTAVADELMLVHRWLTQTRRVRCVGAIGIAASRLPAVASYARGTGRLRRSLRGPRARPVRRRLAVAIRLRLGLFGPPPLTQARDAVGAALHEHRGGEAQ